MKRQPNQYDLLKVLLLILVVAGHVFNRFTPENYPELNTRLLEVINAFINYWHMPAFMAVSGAVFAIGISRGKYTEFQSFAWDKTKRLLIPFIAIGFIFMLPVGLFLHDGNVTMELVKERYLGLFNGDARHLWFILVLFEIFLVQFVAIKLKINDFIALTVGIVVSVLTLRYYRYTLLSLHSCAYYYPCFLTGYIVFRHKIPHLLPISIIGTLACPIGNYLCSAPILDAIFLAIKPVFVIALLFCIIDFVKDYIKPSGKGLFGLLLGYSFSIYFFHVMIIDIIQHYWPMTQANMYIFVVLSFMVALLLPIPIAWLLKKIRCGWMIGEK